MYLIIICVGSVCEQGDGRILDLGGGRGREGRYEKKFWEVG